MIAICLVGFFISLFALISIKAANEAITSLAALFHSQYPIVEQSIDSGNKKLRTWVVSLSEGLIMPSLTGGGAPKSHKQGIQAAIIIPLVLFGAQEKDVLLPTEASCTAQVKH